MRLHLTGTRVAKRDYQKIINLIHDLTQLPMQFLQGLPV
jgi:hypothetical protein